jgi:predicted ATPase/DNA-binding winged helix-turn-helix (wHTH) protein
MNHTEAFASTYRIAFGPFQLFHSQRLLKRDGKPIRIGDKAFDLLTTLLESPGRFFTNAELVERVWRREWVEDINLRVTVSGLRKLLGETAEGGDYIINAVGRGYSFSSAVLVERWPRTLNEGNRAESPPLELALAHLPLPLNSVVGRQREISDVIDLLQDKRVVTIVGPGGIGKTTVAIASASRRAEIQEGVCFVDLAPIQDPALVAANIAAALGLKGTSTDPITNLLIGLSQRLLVVLDNCEHVSETVAEIVEEILRGAPRVAFLVTSREPLRTEGEVVYRLEPLAYPPAEEEIDSARAITFPAVQLFVERTQAAIPGFALTDTLTPAACEICRRLDGIALALQFAAGRVPAFGVTGVAARLDNRFRLLNYGQRTTLPRHRTLESTFDWSFGLLTAKERTVLMRLAVFCSSFSIDAAIEIAGWPPIEEADVTSIIADLVDKSLVVFAGERNRASYRLLETVKAFALARLKSADEVNHGAQRHAQWVLSQCQQFRSSIGGKKDYAAREVARAALDDLRSALGWSFETSNWPLAFDLVSSAVPLLSHLGLTYELQTWITRALEVEIDPEHRLRLFIGLGSALHLSESEPAALNQLYNGAYQLAEELGDVSPALQALWGLVVQAHMTRQPRRSLMIARKFHQTATKNGRRTDVLVGECLMAAGLHALGDLAAAEPYLRNVLKNFSREEQANLAERYPVDHRVVAMRFLASIEWLTGRVASAARTASLAVMEAEDHAPSLFVALSQCACPIAIDRGDWLVASQYINHFYRHCGHHALWRSWGAAASAILDIRSNHSPIALDKLATVLTDTKGYPAPGKHAWYRLQLIKGYLQFGQSTQARSLLVSLIHEAREQEEYWFLPEMLHLKGMIDAADDPADAEANFREAFALARKQGALMLELNVAADCLNAKQLPFYGDAREIVRDASTRLGYSLSLEDAIAARQVLWRNMRQFWRLRRQVE